MIGLMISFFKKLKRHTKVNSIYFITEARLERQKYIVEKIIQKGRK